MKNKLLKKAHAIYQKSGQHAVITYGDKMGLPESRCEPCETETHTCDGLCLVCWSVKK